MDRGVEVQYKAPRAIDVGVDTTVKLVSLHFVTAHKYITAFF